MSEPRDQTGWLVELGCSPPRWWKGRGPDEFTTVAAEAIRFVRREDAERAIGWLVIKGPHEGCKAVEHAWIGGQSAETETP